MNSPTICVTVVTRLREILSSNNVEVARLFVILQKDAKTHWKAHKKICRAILGLSKLNKQQDISQEDPNVFVNHINPKQHARVTQLLRK